MRPRLCLFLKMLQVKLCLLHFLWRVLHPGHFLGHGAGVRFLISIKCFSDECQRTCRPAEWPSRHREGLLTQPLARWARFWMRKQGEERALNSSPPNLACMGRTPKMQMAKWDISCSHHNKLIHIQFERFVWINKCDLKWRGSYVFLCRSLLGDLPNFSFPLVLWRNPNETSL